MPSPKSQNITQTSKVELGPEQKEVFGLALPHIQAYAGSTPGLFPGSAISGFDPAEIFGQDYALGIAAPAAAQLAGQAGNTQSLLMDPGFMLNPNQYLQPAADAVTRQTTENLMENILPKIRGGATSAGGQYSGGSTRRGIAEGQAIGRTSREISDSLAKMYLDNYTRGLSGLMQAVQGNQGVMTQQLFPANIASAVGGQKRAMAQALLEEQVNRFYAQQDMPLLHAQQLLGLVQGMPGATGQTTVQGAMPKPNPLLQAIGLGSTLMGLPGLGMGSFGMGSMMGK